MVTPTAPAPLAETTQGDISPSLPEMLERITAVAELAQQAAQATQETNDSEALEQLTTKILGWQDVLSHAQVPDEMLSQLGSLFEKLREQLEAYNQQSAKDTINTLHSLNKKISATVSSAKLLLGEVKGKPVDFDAALEVFHEETRRIATESGSTITPSNYDKYMQLSLRDQRQQLQEVYSYNQAAEEAAASTIADVLSMNDLSEQDRAALQENLNASLERMERAGHKPSVTIDRPQGTHEGKVTATATAQITH